jgi:hypothetical protein
MLVLLLWQPHVVAPILAQMVTRFQNDRTESGTTAAYAGVAVPL